MKWNNGREQAIFRKGQEELRKQYLTEGMTEEQIQALYKYDLSVFRNKRIEAIHTQAWDFEAILYVNGLKQEESAKKMGIPYRTFKHKLNAIKSFLRNF